MVKNEKKLVSFSVIEYVVNAATIFYGYKLLMRAEGLEALGIWSLITAIMGFAKFGDVSGTLAVIKELSPLKIREDSISIKKIIATSLIIFITIYFLIGLVTAITIHLLLDNNKINQNEEFYWTLVVSPVAILFLSGFAQLGSAVIQALHLGHIKSTINVFANILQAISLAVFIPRFGIEGMVMSVIIQSVTSSLVASIVLKNLLNFQWQDFRPEAIQAKKMLSLSVKTQLNSIANGSIEPIVKVLIMGTLGAEKLGVFELGIKSTQVIRGLIGASVNALTPSLMVDKQSSKVNRDTVKAKVMNPFTLTGSFIILVLAPPILSLLWVGYFDLELILILLLNFIATFSAGFGAPYYVRGIAMGNINVNLKIGLFTAVSSVTLTFILLPRMELIGAAISITISMIASTFLTVRLNTKCASTK